MEAEHRPAYPWQRQRKRLKKPKAEGWGGCGGGSSSDSAEQTNGFHLLYWRSAVGRCGPAHRARSGTAAPPRRRTTSSPRPTTAGPKTPASAPPQGSDPLRHSAPQGASAPRPPAGGLPLTEPKTRGPVPRVSEGKRVGSEGSYSPHAGTESSLHRSFTHTAPGGRRWRTAPT